MAKLHLGCGKRLLPGYVHVDALNYAHIDIIADLRNISPAALGLKEPANEIYACHVLEHFGRNEVMDVLQGWTRCLSPGGTIRIAMPDLEAVMAHYSATKDLKSLLGFFYGGQRDQYDFHKMGFTFDTLRLMLESCGFTDVQRYRWQDFLPDDFDDYSRSYLPHMDFSNGRLMSLNVVAKLPK